MAKNKEKKGIDLIIFSAIQINWKYVKVQKSLEPILHPARTIANF
jgi:hypothetical protein